MCMYTVRGPSDSLFQDYLITKKFESMCRKAFLKFFSAFNLYRNYFMCIEIQFQRKNGILQLYYVFA